MPLFVGFGQLKIQITIDRLPNVVINYTDTNIQNNITDQESVCLNADGDRVEEDDHQHEHTKGEGLEQPAHEHAGHTVLERRLVCVYYVVKVDHFTGGGRGLCVCEEEVTYLKI